jgi:hypothetical protein
MKFLFVGFLAFLCCATNGETMAQGGDVLGLSRDSGVKISSQSGNSSAADSSWATNIF